MTEQEITRDKRQAYAEISSTLDPASDPTCTRVDDQGGCGHTESRHGLHGCESAPGSLVPCWCRTFMPA